MFGRKSKLEETISILQDEEVIAKKKEILEALAKTPDMIRRRVNDMCLGSILTEMMFAEDDPEITLRMKIALENIHVALKDAIRDVETTMTKGPELADKKAKAVAEKKAQQDGAQVH